jgi:6-pyruvoyltetrahydropterin/6-carboxytetrahydropterin synthase
MIIRKKFAFEGAHIVRNCSSRRCALSIHGHSYKVELLLAGKPDRGQMVYDFGLLKTHVKELIDAFDHTTVFWDKDGEEYIQAIKQHSARWISFPVNPTAEMLSLWFLNAFSFLLGNTSKLNGESFECHSVIVHETDSGYAQAFTSDVDDVQLGWLNETIFSEEITKDFHQTPSLHELLAGAGDSWHRFLRNQSSSRVIQPIAPLNQVR